MSARRTNDTGSHPADSTAVSKSQLAYEWLRVRIARHEFGPGYRLVLSEIADATGMSVVPVREAVRRLEAERLVTFERNVGARVAMVDPDEYVHSMQALGVVEGIATALAAPLLAAAELEQAREVNRRLAALLDEFDPHAFTVLNQEFHALLFQACPNPQLLDLVHSGWARLAGLRDSTFAFVPSRARESVAEHDHILDLVAEGADALAIELAARNHRWATMEAFLRSRASVPGGAGGG